MSRKNKGTIQPKVNKKLSVEQKKEEPKQFKKAVEQREPQKPEKVEQKQFKRATRIDQREYSKPEKRDEALKYIQEEILRDIGESEEEHPTSQGLQQDIYDSILKAMNKKVIQVEETVRKGTLRPVEQKKDEIVVSLSKLLPDKVYLDAVSLQFDDYIEKFKEYFDKSLKYEELEASFGFFSTYEQIPGEGNNHKFTPGVLSQIDFSNLKIYLENEFYGEKFSKTETEDVVEIMEVVVSQKGQKDSFEVIELTKGKKYSHYFRRPTGLDDNVDRWNLRKKYDVEYPENAVYEMKKRDNKKYNFYDMGVRVSRSNEKNIDSPPKWIPSLKRHRKRTSFSVRNRKNQFYGMSIDLTMVTESIFDHTTKRVTKTFGPKYEVEVEIKPDQKSSVKTFCELVLYVYLGLISNLSESHETIFTMAERAHVVTAHNILLEDEDRSFPKSKNEDRYDVDQFGFVYLKNTTVAIGKISGEDIKEFTKDDIRVLTDNNIQYNKKAQGGLNYMFKPWEKMNMYHLYDRNYWNKPENIKLRDLMPLEKKKHKQGWDLQITKSVTFVKTNGKRFFMLIIKNNCWLISVPYTITKYGTVNTNDYDGTYLDGELRIDINDNGVNEYSYNAFDILYYRSKSVKNRNFDERYSLLKEFSGIIEPYYGSFTIKIPNTNGDIYQRIRDSLHQHDVLENEDKDSVDGIIIQSSGAYNSKTFKWKPIDKMTIDFFVKPIENISDYPHILNEDNIDRACFLMTKDRRNNIVFTTNYPKKFDGIIIFDESTNYRSWFNTIVEFGWDDLSSSFKPLRIRDDRIHPNGIRTAQEVWEDMHNPVLRSTIEGRDAVVFRKVNNRLKYEMLSKYMDRNGVLVDFGPGRGGDLKKWDDLGLSKVYAIEPNEDNYTIFTDRLRSMQEQAEKKHKPFPDIDLLKFGAHESSRVFDRIGKNRIDSMTSFFSLTFFSKNLDLYDGLLNTLELIPEGGYFFGIVMDGMKTFELLRDERAKYSEIEDIENESPRERLSRELGILYSKIKNHSDDSIRIETEIQRLQTQKTNQKKKYDTEIDNINKTSGELGKISDILGKDEINSQLSKQELKEMNERKQYLIDKWSEHKQKQQREKELLVQTEMGLTNLISEISKQRMSDEKIGERIKFLETELSKPQGNNKIVKDVYYNRHLKQGEFVEYKNFVFSIKQLSELDPNQPISDVNGNTINEIEIDIDDLTAMVKNQTEWLFNFKWFISELSKRGFNLVEDYFMDTAQYKTLPHDSYVFSSLQRAFCFQKFKTPFHFKPSLIGDLSTFSVKGNYDIMIGKVPTKGGSFIHAVLRNIDPKYSNLTEEEKNQYAIDIRQGLAASTTLKIFKSLYSGELVKRMSLAFDTEQKAYDMYRSRLLNLNDEIGESSVLDLISKILKVGIFVVNTTNFGELIPHVYDGLREYCKTVDNYENVIILAKHETYNVIGRKRHDVIDFAFNKTDPLIKQLRSEMCY